ncbi:MAG: hypothetical protein J7L54_05025 [Elusimicrobia bacterium]|nr:hypothetical protein [Elusimicrobiota bacterium]
MKKLNVKTILIIYLFGIIFIFNLTKISDPDFFWHIKTGELIAKNGIQKTDSFSWTFRGKKWFNHEWLSQFAFYATSKTCGNSALIILKSVLITAAFVLLFLTIYENTNSLEISVFMTAISGWLAAITFSIRPQIFSFFLFSLLIFLLFTPSHKKVKLSLRKKIAVPLIFFIWSNFHGLFIIGLFFLFFFAAEEIINNHRPGNITAVFFLSLVASTLNPGGLDSLIHPLKYIFGETRTHLSYIMEWMSPDFHETYGKAFLLFIAISFLGFAGAKQKETVRNILLFLFFLCASLYSVRNIPLFLFVAAPIAGTNLWKTADIALFRFRLKTDRHTKNSKILKLLNYFLTFSFPVLIILIWNLNFGDGFFDMKKYPQKAAEIIKERKPEKILNPYKWGGFLIHNDIPVFIDGRADFYPAKFIRNFFLSTELQENPEVLLKKYNFDLILWEKETPFAFYLENSADWKKIFSDNISEIFIPA